MSGRYFGTDGVRGVAGRELTAEVVFRCCYFAAKSLGEPGDVILVGKDSRLSGDLLEAAVMTGVTLAGLDVHLAGIIPTPALAYLTRKGPYRGGIMVTASHNPVEDNGIKIFDEQGEKLTADAEGRIEKGIEKGIDYSKVKMKRFGSVQSRQELAARYESLLISSVGRKKIPLKAVVDAAYGASANTARNVLTRLLKQTVFINCTFNGSMINVNCGSTHPEKVTAEVKKRRGYIGLALDGDGDRVIMCDERGELVDGDKILGILAKDRRNLDGRSAVVATYMSNLGLEEYLKDNGLRLHRCEVGDQNVANMMKRLKVSLGGEQSGHIIIRRLLHTGDGLITALQVLRAVHRSGKTLHELQREIPVYPQHLVNLRLSDRTLWREDSKVQSTLGEINREYEGRVRVYLRPSGTEDLVRILTESKDRLLCKRVSDRIAKALMEWDSLRQPLDVLSLSTLSGETSSKGTEGSSPEARHPK